MKNATLHIDIPDDLLTDADIVGRAIRLARANWWPLIKFFLPPAVLYWFSSSLITCDYIDSGIDLPAGLVYWSIVVGFTLNFFSLWEWGVRRFALIHCITKSTNDLNASMQIARQKFLLCLVLMFPVLLSEAFLDVLLLVSATFEKLGHSASAAELDPANLVAGALYIFGMMATFPIGLILNCSIFYLVIVVIENASLLKASARFFEMLFLQFKYVMVFATLISAIAVVTLVPVGIVIGICQLIPKSPFKIIAEIVLGTLLYPPFDAFLSAAAAIGAVCLYRQVCARVEGQDILNKLEKLQQKQVPF